MALPEFIALPGIGNVRLSELIALALDVMQRSQDARAAAAASVDHDRATADFARSIAAGIAMRRELTPADVQAVIGLARAFASASGFPAPIHFPAGAVHGFVAAAAPKDGGGFRYAHPIYYGLELAIDALERGEAGAGNAVVHLFDRLAAEGKAAAPTLAEDVFVSKWRSLFAQDGGECAAVHAPALRRELFALRARGLS